MFDYIRTAACVPKVKIGDPSFNIGYIRDMAQKASADGAQILVFPELSVSAYSCADLFFQYALLDTCRQAIGSLASFSKKIPAVLIVGAPVSVENRLYNCAVVLHGGKVLGIVPKTHIPNYSEYYEERWFASAADCKTTKIDPSYFLLSQEEAIPFGTDLLFEAYGATFGIELCEDLWAPVPPSSFASLGGAELIFNLSASNETIGKHEYRRSLLAHQSAACVCGYCYVSAGWGESSTDLIFSGYAGMFENGVCLKENNDGIRDGYYLLADYDLEKLRADRKKRNTYHDGGITRNLSYRKVLITDRQADSDGSLYPVDKLPFVPASKKDRLARCLSIFEMQAMGLVRRCEVVGYHPVIGVSGGLDSTLALLVCAFAMKKADRSLSDITAITLPCFGTTGRTHNNALDLMKKLGVTSLEIDIKEACTLHCRDIDHPKDSFDVTYENIQARERTQVLMDYACKIGGFVVGTGDLSELALGWCTYNADHMSMYGVNAGVPKTLIRWMIESVMENELFPQVNDILKDILATPISPELLPPDEKGNIVQQTEELIGPYALHDFFLYYMLRFGFSPDKIFLLAKRAFLQDFSPKTILHWEKVFYRRFFSQQFKRSCLPDGVKVGSVALSPRGDWRMPSDASARMWLDVLEQIDE